MKKSLLVLALAAAFAPTLAFAEAGDIVVRVRATNVAPQEKSKLGETTTASTLGFTGTQVYGSPDANLIVDSNTIPEIDFSYYITKNIAAELILAVGTRHDVSVSGTGGVLNSRELGSVNLLPPTLTAQWHFMPDTMFDPYVGGGAAFVLGMDRGLVANTSLGGGTLLPIKIDRGMFGGVLQAGLDVNLQDKWLINFDVKKVWFNTDVKIQSAGNWIKIDNLDINPWVFSIGLGKKF